MSQHVGIVTSLARFPVKSMLGELPDSVDVTEGGVAGDRAYALSDKDTGRIISAKNPRRYPGLLACRATYVDAPSPGTDPPPARIDLPDGTSVTTDAPDVDTVLSTFLEHDVAVVRSSPDDYTIDEFVPDIDGVRPGGVRDTLTQQRIGNALFTDLGMPTLLPDGSLQDLFPLTVMTTSSIAHFEQLQPGSSFDPRRFRMNVVVDTLGALGGDAFVENEWVGQQLEFGGTVRFAIALAAPRCVMTTLAVEELPRDNFVLQAIAKHNRLDIAGGARYPCAGVYAVTGVPGTIRVGDPVTLLPAPVPAP